MLIYVQLFSHLACIGGLAFIRSQAFNRGNTVLVNRSSWKRVMDIKSVSVSVIQVSLTKPQCFEKAHVMESTINAKIHVEAWVSVSYKRFSDVSVSYKRFSGRRLIKTGF